MQPGPRLSPSDLRTDSRWSQAAVVAVVGSRFAPFYVGTLGICLVFLLTYHFAGAALTATSIGITAKVLAEIRTLSSAKVEIIIGAAVLDDVLRVSSYLAR